LTMVDIAAARERATELLERFSVKNPPVPVERIAKQLGIIVQYAPFDDELSGMAFLKEGAEIIGINSNHHPNRQRYTLAHELAHICLHHSHLEAGVHVDQGSVNSLRRDLVSQEGTDPLEREANAFAAELLMPRKLLAGALDDRMLDLDDDRLIALAKRFKVSLMALQYRLQRL
jgi:Zn-dependent peptidase ImmA (M78 family)